MVLLDRLFCDKIFVKIPFGIPIVKKSDQRVQMIDISSSTSSDMNFKTIWMPKLILTKVCSSTYKTEKYL